MTQKIWKFTFNIATKIMAEMPKGAKILHLGIQANTPTLWAIFDQANEFNFERREFEIIGTGFTLNHKEGYRDNYIGTWQDGEYVWHLFEWCKY